MLSILIPSIVTRSDFLRRLIDALKPQMTTQTQVIVDIDNGERSIGAKRQSLIERATTEYLCFIDDDDLVASDYVARILEALHQGPDIVGFYLRNYIDDRLDSAVTLSQQDRRKPLGGRDYRGVRQRRRRPNHLCPIRREIATVIGFKPWNAREDQDYAERLAERYPDLREIFIDEFLYDYWLRTNRSGEMTNAHRTKT